MGLEALRGLLEGHGYEVRFREHEWVECFLYAEGESWTGRGPDPKAALENAVAHACPSAIAKALLQRAVADAERPIEPRAPSNPSNGHRSRSVPPVLVSKAPPPPPDLARSLDELTTLEQRIRDMRDELGLCSGERQRLALYAFICEARGHTDLFPDEARVRDQVTVISRLLTEIGKSFWPGSVTALQLQMNPRDLPRHLLGGVATTWIRAAELAERALTALEYADERRGFDGYGWADPAESRPPPVDLRARLDALYAEIEDASGALERQAEPRQGAQRPDPIEYLRWVRSMRWLRSRDADPVKWARIAGRLRWWGGRREGGNGSPAARELDPAFVPPTTWIDLLEGSAEIDPVKALPNDLIERVRGAYAGKRIVFIGMRRDPELQANLEGALDGAALDWRVVEPKRLVDLQNAIAMKSYDVVLGALGFSHMADHVLARACRDAGIGYVRVNRGRPIVCLRAMARAAEVRG
jgi:hypothetical protein